jgi:hypothetical protein
MVPTTLAACGLILISRFIADTHKQAYISGLYIVGGSKSLSGGHPDWNCQVSPQQRHKNARIDLKDVPLQFAAHNTVSFSAEDATNNRFHLPNEEQVRRSLRIYTAAYRGCSLLQGLYSMLRIEKSLHVFLRKVSACINNPLYAVRGCGMN